MRTHPSRRTDPAAAEVESQARALIAQLVSQRRALGLTQVDLGNRIGTSQRTVSQLENYTHDPKLSTIISWGGALGLRLTLEEGSPSAPAPETTA